MSEEDKKPLEPEVSDDEMIRSQKQYKKELAKLPKGTRAQSTWTAEELRHITRYAAGSPEAVAILAENDKRRAADDLESGATAEAEAKAAEDNAHRERQAVTMRADNAAARAAKVIRDAARAASEAEEKDAQGAG